MDMSTPSTAQSLDGALDASVVRETSVAVRDGRERDDLGERDIAASLESTNDIPMQFVRLGLPAAIFLWFVFGLLAYGAYRFFAG
jgi:hypothetical protein